MLHESAFGSVDVSVAQLERMAQLRAAAKEFSDVLERVLPDGPDKTFTLRNHRTTAMWAVVTITRNTDGSPREGLQ